jgi:hypothetical protein
MVEKRFRALRIIGTFLKVLAWIVLVLGILGGLAAIVSGGLGAIKYDGGEAVSVLEGLLAGGIGGLVIMIMAAIYFVALYASGESIYLLIAVEENTRETALLLKQAAQPVSQPVPTNPQH